MVGQYIRGERESGEEREREREEKKNPHSNKIQPKLQ